MSRLDPTTLADLLSRRRRVLQAIQTEALPKPEVVTAAGVSRSTVDRAVRELERADLVATGPDGVSLTLRGRLAQEAYDSMLDHLDAIVDATGLSGLPSGASLPLALFDDPEVVGADGTAPARPMEAITDLFARAVDVKTYATVVLPQTVATSTDRVRSGVQEVELVATPEVLAELIGEHADAFDTAMRSGGLAVWQASDLLPYGIVIATLEDADPVVAITMGDHGALCLVRTDDPAAVAWARDQFEAIRETAVRLG